MSKIKIFGMGGLDENGKNTYIVEVDNNGVIKGISDGKTGVKITDITTNIETLIDEGKNASKA